jgi:hypothetical protein
VAGWVLALAVGLVTGAGPLANVSSIIWSRWSRGRDKIRSLAALQAVFASAFLVAAVAPPSPAGLALLAAAVLTARIVWCGVVTIRASLWRANYSRRARTAFVARVQAVVAVIVAVVGAAAGLLLDLDPRAQRWMFLAAAGFCLAGLVALRRLKLRGQRRRLRAELAGGAENTFNLNSLKRILANDPNYRRYLGCLFVLGSGTLMATAPLILVLGRDLSVSAVTQVLITGSLPTLLIPLATPYWSRKLAERHAIAYRALLSRVFVAAAAAALAGATLSWLPLLWLSAPVPSASPGSNATSTRREPELPCHEHDLIRGVSHPQRQRLALTVAGAAVDPQQHGVSLRIRRGGGLQGRRHLARVQRVHARVVFPGGQQRRGVRRAGLDVLIG